MAIDYRCWRRGPFVVIAALALAALLATRSAAGDDQPDGEKVMVGARGSVGCGPRPRVVQRLAITEPGVYENILVDGQWVDSTLVKINADNATLRNCEIRNGTHNAVTVYA